MIKGGLSVNDRPLLSCGVLFMRTLEVNDWIILNRIIYKIYSSQNMTDMRQQLLEQLKIVIDFDCADFYIEYEDERENGNLITYNCDPDIKRIKYDIDNNRKIICCGKDFVFRDTDITSDERRIKKDYYKEVYEANKWHYSLKLILAKHKEYFGMITLYKVVGKENFSNDDIFIMDMLKEHLSLKIYQKMEDTEEVQDKLTIAAATDKYSLTNRENTILRLLLEGKNNERVCDELLISINTLKKHIINIYRKLVDSKLII